MITRLLKRVFCTAVFLLGCIELFLYSFSDFDHLYSGVPRGIPRFRDIYILTINRVCNIPVHLFPQEGACSHSFYGLPMSAGFDYPLPLFFISKLLPEYLFLNPSILAFLSGISFLLCVYLLVMSSQERSNTLESISILLIYLAYPTRYMLERGQIDTLNWTMAIVAVLTLIPRRKELGDVDKDKSSSISNIRLCISILVLFLSTLVKGFTLPALLIWSIYLYRSKRRIPALLGFVLTPISAFTILGPLARIPGAHATFIQIEPGEIFGFSVGIFTQADYITKILFICVGVVLALSSSNKCKYSPSLSLLAIVSTSAYLAFYFLSVSANYKLVSAAFVLYTIVRRHLVSTTRQATTTNISVIQIYSFPIILCFISILVFNYRPYIPEIQFLSQALFDNIIMPTTIGFTAAYLFGILFTSDKMCSLSIGHIK